jgi:hypothetical protein
LQADNRNGVDAILPTPPLCKNLTTISALHPSAYPPPATTSDSNVSVVETNDRKTMIWESRG